MQYLTPDQICQIFQIKKDKLYKMTAQKCIPFLKVGKELRFDANEVSRAFEAKSKQLKRVLV